DVERLLHDAGIIRNRAKIEATIRNAQLYLELRAQTTLSDYLWRYVDGQPIVNRHAELTQVPQYTPLAETVSKDLRKRGFKFVGPTTVYAFLQAAGLVNDHLVSCERWAQVQTLRR
ncbi:MAG: DNA-3-methyladenine glycosylase I, partial [Bacteroidia bacterium]|nr:DNA-3-methyladenine glycosylase I [Bacteroidia bacterium]